jgi:hypothetical protein
MVSFLQWGPAIVSSYYDLDLGDLRSPLLLSPNPSHFNTNLDCRICPTSLQQEFPCCQAPSCKSSQINIDFSKRRMLPLCHHVFCAIMFTLFALACIWPNVRIAHSSVMGGRVEIPDSVMRTRGLVVCDTCRRRGRHFFNSEGQAGSGFGTITKDWGFGLHP